MKCPAPMKYIFPYLGAKCPDNKNTNKDSSRISYVQKLKCFQNMSKLPHSSTSQPKCSSYISTTYWWCCCLFYIASMMFQVCWTNKEEEECRCSAHCLDSNHEIAQSNLDTDIIRNSQSWWETFGSWKTQRRWSEETNSWTSPRNTSSK